MAYTNSWDETFPPDSELANLLANNQRKIELNIRERMDDVFTDATGTFAASGPTVPVVPSARITGKDASRVRIIHWSKFIPAHAIDGTDAWNVPTDLYGTAVASSGTGPVTLYCPLEFGQPAAGTAITIVGFDMLVDPLSLGVITLTLQKNTYVSPTPVATVLGTDSSTNTTGVAIFAVTGINYLVLQGEHYYFKIVMPISGISFKTGRLYGVRLNLSVPFDARANLA